MRRPSPALAIALLALFVALDGPAAAQRTIDRLSGSRLRDNTVTGAKIKNGTLQRQDLSARARGSLRRPANRSVTAAKIAPNAVTSDGIRARAVGTDELADGSVETKQVADGSLGARDVAAFSGLAELDFPAVPAQQCISRSFDIPGNARIPDAVIAITAPNNWLDGVSVSAVQASEDRRFRIVACNPSPAPTSDPDGVRFRYAVFPL